jgi:alkylation response protein AidB-like acyl-CoA dehydrogenase
VPVEVSEDQQFLQDTTRKFLAAESPLAAVRALEDDPAGFDALWWRRGAELGWTSLLVPEADGGGSLSEHGLLDLILVAEEMGRLVSPGPLVPVNVVASALGAHGTPEQRAAVLPGLLSGEAVAAWTGTEPIAAEPAGQGGLVLTGRASPVEAGAQADHLLVTVGTAAGPGLVLVPAGAPGLEVTPLEGLDLVRRFADVRLEGVAVPAADVVLVPGAEGAEAAVERLLSIAVVLQCAETVGVLHAVFEMTVEYLGDRYSFGRPLSSYQALKHRVADDKLVLEACAAVAVGAAEAVAGVPDVAGPATASEVVSAAKAWIGAHADELVQDCVQLHGGIGITWEHDLHLYLRRATVNRVGYGTPELHRERLATVALGAGDG